jgi:hypothetical protein
MSLTITRSTMSLPKGIEMWASGGAAIGVIAELVDVEAALGVGVVACDVVGYCCRTGFGGLFEGYGSGDFGVAAEDCYCGGCQMGARGVGECEQRVRIEKR